MRRSHSVQMCAEQNDLRIGAQAKISEQADRRTRGTTDGKRNFTTDSTDDTRKKNHAEESGKEKKNFTTDGTDDTEGEE
jgi:hypothetical protein